ncbi:p21-activated protein kinase-interacting protein 1-like [Tribolium castaneum]|uniref:p21-activated protein kinase-interacting protein 1-like n=1 Tax=Tribolium castaneum TaxID=7070 RepID=D6WDJ5_TRICA|nr:PREDICTED: p21-activated protein kinase-interacting protein 1-like [Tribolium castaneum]EFA00787.1 p21-activated protein kinase-interacting protein 1-like [Tribolium castaneum]|eukprot:XP_968119.1 PREDICTED: p21-activated protein kinase-interacting protein 1-like [Tribolium castaneum]
MVKAPSFEVIAGSYEEFLLGYNFSSKENQLVQSFAAHDHSASVRCVALSGPYLASGGADDRIFIYDLKSRKQHCTLTHHDATITCLQFTENHSHLISGSSDGVLAIVRVGNWQLEKVWEKAHKGAAILDIAVHNSGKLALSLGADCHLCTWNLVKGRQAYVINLSNKCKNARSLERISWAPDEVRFLLYGGKFTEIWSIETGGVLKQVEHGEKVTACVWLSDSVLLVGHENGEVSVLNLEDNSTEVFKAHGSRIKGIALYKKKIITISSGGEIKVWNKDFEELAVIESGCRLTCLCVVPPVKVKSEENTNEESVSQTNTEVTENKKIVKAQVVEEIEDNDEEIQVRKSKKKKVVLEGHEQRVKKKKKKT